MRDQLPMASGPNNADGIAIEAERYELFEAPWHEFEVDRRDFLKTLGGGILVGWLLVEAPAQRRRGRGNAAPQNLGAWLHIDEAGQVTVFCGKAEVGQNVRTMVAQIIAEELRLSPPLDRDRSVRYRSGSV